MVPEIKNMTAQELLFHFQIEKGESELYDLVPLLIIAAGSCDEVFKILEQIRDEDKTLKAYYPYKDKTMSGGVLIGEIDDGMLYLI